MTEALRAAMESAGITTPNPAVGCVLVGGGAEIARGATESYGGRHAERVAFDRVEQPEMLCGATAYVTLEPCSHFGHQPPCVDLLCSSPVARVVIAARDPNPLVNGRGIDRLLRAGKSVTLGPLMHEEIAWNLPFHAFQRMGRPLVVAKWEQTIDGALANGAGQSGRMTGPAARTYEHWLRQRYDAIVVGSRTVLTDASSLTVKDCRVGEVRNPLRVILDKRGHCFVQAGSAADRLRKSTFAPPDPVLLITAVRDPPGSDFVAWLRSAPTVRILPVDESDFEPTTLLGLAADGAAELLGRPAQSFMIEGGSAVLSCFVGAGAVDVCHAFVAPVLSGSRSPRLSFETAGRRGNGTLAGSAKYEIVAHELLGDDILIELASAELLESVFGDAPDALRLEDRSLART